MDKPDADMLFEVSWEVCNKVGGIHTVLTTKIEIMKKYYKNYFLIGPYFEEKAKIGFEEKSPPSEMKTVFDELEKEGIKCYFGHWFVNERYDTILIDFKHFVEQKDKIKQELWEEYKIDSLRSGWEFEEPVLWSFAVGKLLDKLSHVYPKEKIVAHLHEWMAGVALLYLKNENSRIATVFTTHATMLGRTLAGNGYDLYRVLDSIDPEQKAYELGVQDKFQIERACAVNADAFSTVSEITALEAEKLLGRKPDVLTLNGIDIKRFPTVEEFSLKHVTCREKLRDYLTSHFFPYYTFDLSHTMMMYISGRYEFRNKGIDLFIKALGKLNKKLMDEKSKRTIAVFFWIPLKTNGIKNELLENKNYYRHIKNYVTFNTDKILSNIVHNLVSQKDISKNNILSSEFIQELKKDLLSFKRKGTPLICTHYLDNEIHNPMLAMLKESGLVNSKENNVKVVLNPVYLEGNDGLINLQYYDAVAGCHLGVFPSFYEPWGYTPLESVGLGVPSVTSNLAGFGRFMSDKIKNDADDGIFILDRFNKSEGEVLDVFSDLLYDFSHRDKHQRASNKLNAKAISDLADWNILVHNYIDAHNLALRKHSE